MELKIKKVMVVCQTYGTDEVHITLDSEHTPYPELNESYPGEYEPVAIISVRKGYAQEWCSKMGIHVDHIINTGHYFYDK